MVDEIRAGGTCLQTDPRKNVGDHSVHGDAQQKSFSVFIINSAGQMLIQKRSKTKAHCAGLWSNACSSSTFIEEPAHDAALRRLREELGVCCSLYEAFPFMYRANANSQCLQGYNHVFIGICDDDPHPNLGEIDDVTWVAIPELLQRIQEHPEHYAPWFRLSIEGVALFIRHSLFNRAVKNDGCCSECCAAYASKPAFQAQVATLTPIKVEQLANVVAKSWGHEEWIVNNAEFCGKKLVFVAGHQCSMHHHRIKNETFYVLAGKMYLETRLDDQEYARLMSAGDIAHITRGMWHRVTALENTEVIEFSTFHMDEDSYRCSTSGKADLAAMGLEVKGEE